MKSSSHLVDVQSAFALADSRCRQLGADHFAYMVLCLPGSRHGQFPFVLSNHPAEWNRSYDERRYLEHDPIVEIGLASLLPFSWDADLGDVFSYRSDDYEASARMSPVQRRLMEEAGQFGVRYGYSIPIHGPGGEFALLTLTAEKADSLPSVLQSSRCDAMMLGLAVHTAMRRCLLPPAPSPPPRVSICEREVLLWSARGKSSWEISRILAKSEDTVNFHLKNVAKKLAVQNKCQAVAVAVQKRIVMP